MSRKITVNLSITLDAPEGVTEGQVATAISEGYGAGHAFPVVSEVDEAGDPTGFHWVEVKSLEVLTIVTEGQTPIPSETPAVPETVNAE